MVPLLADLGQVPPEPAGHELPLEAWIQATFDGDVLGVGSPAGLVGGLVLRHFQRVPCGVRGHNGAKLVSVPVDRKVALAVVHDPLLVAKADREMPGHGDEYVVVRFEGGVEGAVGQFREPEQAVKEVDFMSDLADELEQVLCGSAGHAVERTPLVEPPADALEQQVVPPGVLAQKAVQNVPDGPATGGRFEVLKQSGGGVRIGGDGVGVEQHSLHRPLPGGGLERDGVRLPESEADGGQKAIGGTIVSKGAHAGLYSEESGLERAAAFAAPGTEAGGDAVGLPGPVAVEVSLQGEEMDRALEDDAGALQ